MTGYRPVLLSRAAEAVSHLPPDIKRAVRAAVRELIANPDAGETLHGELEGLRKYRVRRYRVIYRMDRAAKVINILAVGQRRSIYEEVAELLRQTK
jgi:mRNA interferase RelE/StbE